MKINKELIIEEKEISNYKNINIENKKEWSTLWIEKNDKYSELLNDIEDKYIKETKDYYIGMTETAISFYEYNKSNMKSNNMSLCRKIINDKEYRYSTNAIIDYKERDIAEYVKYIFFIKNKNQEMILNYLNKINYKKINKFLIYSRLLYPSYYFEIIDKYFEEKINIDKDIINLINKIRDYENLLYRIFNIYFKNSSINLIDWIEKARD